MIDIYILKNIQEILKVVAGVDLVPNISIAVDKSLLKKEKQL